MSENQELNEISHEQADEAELARLEGFGEKTSKDEDDSPPFSKPRRFGPWVITIIVIASIVVISLVLIALKRGGSENTELNVSPNDENSETAGQEVRLSPEVLASAGIETEAVTQRPAIALVTVAGTVEANPQQTQAVTSLVGGRVERIFVSIGDRVSAGQIVATLTSTEIAEKYGKWHEAETRVSLARKNLERVRRSENRAAVLQAKARLDEADATLKRTRRLIELGAGAGKDLIAAETNYQTAKADYDYQRNISLNKEIQEAEAELQTALVDADHQKRSLQALGVDVGSPAREVSNIAAISLRAPVGGIVTERTVSGGAGIEPGTALMTIANISTVWIIANVPENLMPRLHVGTPAEIKVAAFGEGILNGNISYIDPQLNEETRTGRVRIEVPNPDEGLKSGMFVEVGFQTGAGAGGGEELVVPSSAVQRIGKRTIVFIPKGGEPGVFEVRNIEIGSVIEGYHRVISGLELGEKVVTKGSFTLKTQMQKAELGEE